MATGIVVPLLALLVVAVTGKNEGMAIWENDEAPGYALWDGSRFSTSHQILDIGGTGNVIRGAYSPILRDEAIVIFGGARVTETKALIYSGGQWNSLPFSPLGDGGHTAWTFDVRYESQSGNPLIVWLDESGQRMRYATRTGSKWTLGTIPTPIRCHKIDLEANPTSNHILLAAGHLGISTPTAYAIMWDGDRWTDAVEVKRDYTGNVEKGNVAFEKQSGRAIVMFGDETKFMKYRIWNGVSWGGAVSVTPPAGFQRGPVRRVLSCSDPSSNRILAAMTSGYAYTTWVAVWDGNNNWGSSRTIVSRGSQELGRRRIAVAFEGISQRALFAYTNDGNEVRYHTWSSSSGWSKGTRGPKLDDRPYSMALHPDNGSNDIMLAVRDYSGHAYFCNWNGTGWGGAMRMNSEFSHKSMNLYQPDLFTWKQVADTKAPTAYPTHHPTPPPTPLPTRTPSTKPTRQPTDAPTPQPTRIPTSQPSTSPTTSPTSLPTRIPTQSPTRAPSLKPSKIPTPAKTNTKAADPDNSALATNNDVEGTVAAGRPCESNVACKSRTCRNGVCMATSACYPLKHKFGEPFFEHKVNVVFVASGFDSATKEVWQAHVNRTYKSFENYNMFSNEVEQLNMFRVDPWELDSSYCVADCVGIARLLCCDQHRALNLAEKCFPVGSNLQTVVIHNDERYGGAGYVDSNIATVTTHPLASLIAAHELGHSLFDLTDEYSYGSGTDAEPNCDTNSSCYKWSDLIGNTPAGYDPVKCLPGCRNNNFSVGAKSFMNDLNSPMGAVNDRFTCCTYCALTKSFPSYCDVFDQTPNYLFNYCSINDYQGYGSASYEKEPLLFISDGLSVQDSSTKYVQVEYPVSVSTTTKIKRSSGEVVYRSKQSPLEAGMFLRSHVEGDFSSPRMAKKLGFDSVLKVVLLYRGARQTLFISPNITIEVPMSQDPVDDDDEPLAVSEQAESFNIVADTKGKPLKKVRVKLLDLS